MSDNTTQYLAARSGSSLSKGVSRLLGSELVTITVGSGPQASSVTIHKSLIAKQSIVFDRMFSTSFKEGLTQTAALPDDLPEVFAVFIDWINADKLCFPENFTEQTSISIMAELENVIHFADKYCIDTLSDVALEYSIKLAKRYRLQPQHEIIDQGYKNTMPKSKFRLYLGRTYAYQSVSDLNTELWGPPILH